MPSWPSRACTVAAFFGVIALSRHASADAKWLEWHESSSDVRLTLHDDGRADVERHVRLRVVAGPIRSLDLGTIDRGVVPAPIVDLHTEAGDTLSAHVEVGEAVINNPNAPHTDQNQNAVLEEPLRVVIDQPEKGLKRGVYDAVVRYELDLVATKRITRDKSLFKLTWLVPPSPEGHDAVRAIFEIPAAPTEPHGVDPSQLVTLERVPTLDRLTLTRAHVAKGEGVAWIAQLDPRALPHVTSPDLRPPPPRPMPHDEQSPLRIAVFAIAFVYAVAAAAIARLRESSRDSRVATLLAPAPAFVRVWCAPILSSAALLLALFEHALVGGALFAVVAILFAERRAKAPRVVRGPGVWTTRKTTELAPHEMPRKTARIAFVLAVIVTASLHIVARASVFGLSYVVPLAALPLLLPLLAGAFGGSDFESDARAMLDDFAGDLESENLVVEAISRVPEGATAPDEWRLAVLPKEPMFGLIQLDLVCVKYTHFSGTAALPEILARVAEGSHAHAALLAMDEGRAFVPGRRAGERVLRIVPDSRSRESTLACLLALCERMSDRRQADASASPVKKDRRDRRRILAASTFGSLAKSAGAQPGKSPA